ncbi:hypothetical protein [Agrococcus citreus]|uniref:Uncharacterized protein n=1 Tax=Agrococcus citreus TaxID=84643 RepID=A0ABN1YXX8_9MICO
MAQPPVEPRFGRAVGLDAVTDERCAVALGAVAGLCWAAAQRGWMVLIAGRESTITWRTGPFVLLPGAIVGAAHGFAAHRRGAGLPVPRWVPWSPLAFAAALLEPSAAKQLVTTGIGSGAVFDLLLMMGGGFALRPTRSGAPEPDAVRRVVGGLVAITVLGQAAAGAVMAGRVSIARGVSGAALGGGLMVLAGLAATLGHDRPRSAQRGVTPR